MFYPIPVTRFRCRRKAVRGYLLLLSAIAACCLAPGAALANTAYVSLSGNDGAAGSATAPWRTIQHGVDTLHPGDTLLIGPGVYRERIEIKHSGTPQAPITLAALPGAHVIVSGADRLNGWQRVDGAEESVYVHDWPYRFPIGGPNDLTHPGDLEHRLTGRAEQIIHGGRLLRQALTRPELAPGTFYADLEAKKLYVWLRGSDDPNNSEMEASVRGQWLSGLASYIHVRGITFRYAANHAQRGAFFIGQEGGNAAPTQGWVVEDCVFERANGAGASITGPEHIFRRCLFQDNGQIGFGTSRSHNTRLERCGIYRNNVKGYSTGWEAGGCKVTMSRGFVFDGCRSMDNRGVGIWFDIGNEQSEVKNCFIADNDEAGIFYEISYGLHAHDNLIVNNANNGESPGGGWGSGGITLSSSQDCVVEHNTLIGNRDGIDLREQDRTTPRIDSAEGAQEVRIFNRNHIIRANIIAYSQAYNIGFWLDTTFFGPHPSGGDRNRPLSEDPKTLHIQVADNLLWPLPGRPNYLYGVPWRPKSKTCRDPADFSAFSGIPDTSRVADPRFADVTAGDYRLLPGSPAAALHIGVQNEIR
jgi:parallel beta-helix repeat protein